VNIADYFAKTIGISTCSEYYLILHSDLKGWSPFKIAKYLKKKSGFIVLMRRWGVSCT
jgi:hypothetical protein